MSYATDVSPLVFDLETAGLPNAADFLEPVQPARNLKDPEKIKADVEARTKERLEKLALDWNVGRIVALAWWTERDGEVVGICRNETDERTALSAFWGVSKHRTLVGFNIKAFDLRFLVRRSQLLGVPHPMLNFSKYDRRGITDLFLDLTFGDGTYDQGAMRRTLKAFCRRFGIPVADEIDGKDIAALVEVGDWDRVATHVESDLRLTLALAQRLGVVPTAVPVEVA